MLTADPPTKRLHSSLTLLYSIKLNLISFLGKNLEDLNKWPNRAKKGALLDVMPVRICQDVHKANLVMSPSIFTILNTNTNNINCE